jgi:N-acetyl-gamma-glutamyl-phosphate reductase/acetylglutamate kinase
MSGYSGAGTKAGQKAPDGRSTTIPKTGLDVLKGGVLPYALTDHIHEREASTHLSTLIDHPLKIAFIPNVAPWFSGIISVLSAPLKKEFRAAEVKEMYLEKYEGEKLIKVSSDVVRLEDVEGYHGWRVGGIQVHSGGRRVVVVVRCTR